MVGGHEHNFVRLDIKHIGDAQLGGRVGLVGPEDFSA